MSGIPPSRSPTSISSSIASPPSRRAGSGPRTASSARPTSSCWPRASRAMPSWRRWRSSALAGAPRPRGGAGGRTLTEEWADVARAYLGMSVPGFPNLFLLYGPNTNGGAGSVIYTLEAAMGHVIAALDELARADAQTIELRPETLEAYDRELRQALAGTVWHSGCTSWYLDENGNDPSQWPWLWSTYRRRAAQIEPGTYELSRG